MPKIVNSKKKKRKPNPVNFANKNLNIKKIWENKETMILQQNN